MAMRKREDEVFPNAAGVDVRRIRETSRLRLQAGLSYDEVGRALKISKSVVGKYVSLARVAGVDWTLAQTLSDDELEARLYRPALPRSSPQLAPDFAAVHQELKRAGVTLQLLCEEYARGNALAYKYTSFCAKYRAWASGLKRSMRQVHVAGEKLFVDYAGQSVPLIDAATGEIRRAQIFVAVLGASNYTYACATATQNVADWVGPIIDALEFIGGVPRLIVPDQTRALIKHPDRYDPEPNRLYEEFAAHYGCALLATRPAHPRDKALTSWCTLCGWLSGNEPRRPAAVPTTRAFDGFDFVRRRVQAPMIVAVQVPLEDALPAELMDGGR